TRRAAALTSAAVIALLLALFATVPSPLREPGPLSPRIANYRIRVRLDAAQHTLSGDEVLEWRNDGGAPTAELYFHLYLDAFQEETTAMRRDPRHALWPHGAPRGWGSVDVSAIRCLDQEVSLAPLEDGTVARVALPRAVRPGETVRCAI